MNHMVTPYRHSISINKPLILIGDTHGVYSAVYDILEDLQEPNTFLFLGDNGLLGQSPNRIKYLAGLLSENNCDALMLRGNHDNPYLYDGRIVYGTVTLMEDFTELLIGQKTALCVGGGISLDRSKRVPQKSYKNDYHPENDCQENFQTYLDSFSRDRMHFEDEMLPKPMGTKKTYDTIFAHVGPKPPGFISTVRSLFHDDTLDDDLLQEQKTVDMYIHKYKPYRWYCGRYHTSTSFTTRGVKVKVLNVNESLLFQDR